MGSCLSNDKKPDDKEELTCQDNRQTKIESAQLRRVAQMTFEEKLEFVQSIELTEYMRLCGGEKKNALKETLQQVAPSDNSQLILYIKQIMSKIQLQKNKTPPTNNPNHSQFASVTNRYFSNLEQPLAEYLKGKPSQNRTLHECFYVTTLQDSDLKAEEKWWGTGNIHSTLFMEMDHCAKLFDATVKKQPTDYLSDIYVNLNQASEKGDVVSQVLRGYLPKLYKQTIDTVSNKH